MLATVPLQQQVAVFPEGGTTSLQQTVYTRRVIHESSHERKSLQAYTITAEMATYGRRIMRNLRELFRWLGVIRVLLIAPPQFRIIMDASKDGSN
jgi:hypothetical protein